MEQMWTLRIKSYTYSGIKSLPEMEQMWTFARPLCCFNCVSKWQEQKHLLSPLCKAQLQLNIKGSCRPNQSEATFGFQSLSSSTHAFTF